MIIITTWNDYEVEPNDVVVQAISAIGESAGNDEIDKYEGNENKFILTILLVLLLYFVSFEEPKQILKKFIDHWEL